MNDDIRCPYCEHGFEYNGDGMNDEESHEEDCPKCDKSFMITAHYHVSYSSNEAPCLNGEEHDYRKITGFPKEYFENKRRCFHCGKETQINGE